MPRIQALTPPYPSELERRFGRLLPPGMAVPRLFATVARNAGLFTHLVDSGLVGPTGLLDRGALPPALRELLILRTCVATRNDYEWQLHVNTIAAHMGLSEPQIDDTRAPRPDARLWRSDELVAMALVDGLVARLDVDDGLYARLREHFDEPRLIEMTQLVGLYIGVALLVALARPDIDAFARPPGGKKVKQADRPDSVRGVAPA